MGKKERIIRLIEYYINDFRKNEVEGMYGTNSKIKIIDFNYSSIVKSLCVESKIILGDTINESVMDREVADILVQDAIQYFYSDIPVKVSVDWES